jgi:hypothetical protein
MNVENFLPMDKVAVCDVLPARLNELPIVVIRPNHAPNLPDFRVRKSVVQQWLKHLITL